MEGGAVGVPLGVDGREELGRGMFTELENDGVDTADRDDGGGGRRGIATVDADVDLGGYT